MFETAHEGTLKQVLGKGAMSDAALEKIQILPVELHQCLDDILVRTLECFVFGRGVRIIHLLVYTKRSGTVAAMLGLEGFFHEKCLAGVRSG